MNYQLTLWDTDEWTEAMRQEAIAIMEAWIAAHGGDRGYQRK